MCCLNGGYGRKVAALLFTVLLLHSGVNCQEDDAAAPDDAAATDAPPVVSTAAPDGEAVSAASVPAGEDAGATAAPDSPSDDSAAAAGAEGTPASVATGPPAEAGVTDGTKDTTGQTADVALAEGATPAEAAATPPPSGTILPSSEDVVKVDAEKTDEVKPDVETSDGGAVEAPAQPVAPVEVAPTPFVFEPTVECVKEEALKDKSVVKVELNAASNCEDTASRLKVPSSWCPLKPCLLQVFQAPGSNSLTMTSSDVSIQSLEKTLGSTAIKEQLGVVNTEAKPAATGGSAVFVTVLILGLLLAAALIGGFCLKNRRGHSSKAMRLAEESYPADEENQGNTLVSVAPLTPPEALEKPAVNGETPAVNGESQEPAKTQPPPTNGHSTTKTADTEL